MPFRENLTDIYENYIKKPLEQEGHVVKRADDIFKSSPIMEDVIHQIKISDVIIADLTGKNPNVFYELGRAHEANKFVIQISQQDHLPFDTRHIRTILYTDNPEGYGFLTENLKKYVKTIQKELQINEIIDKLEESKEYVEAILYSKLISEWEEELSPRQINKVAEAAYDNPQVFESYRAREYLQPLFKKYISIIPNNIIRHLEYNGYKF
ncbi:MAG: hypothetical protein ACFFAT_08790 [Promethearchaeota archaeon]